MSVETAAITRVRYRAETPWGPWGALIATVAVVGASVGGSVTVAVLLRAVSGPNLAEFDRPAVWAAMLCFQTVAVVVAAWLAGWFGGRRRRVLAIDLAAPGLQSIINYFLLLALPSLAYTFLIYWGQPEVVRADMATFLPMVQSNAWPIYAVIIAVGAPLSEELLFRGFLQSALAKSRLGFAGASIVTTAAWSMLHIQYSAYGLAEIVVVGLFLCWVLWRTGSLWATIILHGLYNGAQFVGVALRLFPWT